MTRSRALPPPLEGDGGRYRLCFVCTGNICRSPMADVVLRHLITAESAADGRPLADRLVVSSAGTGPWHEGRPMDQRARTALLAAGYRDHGHVAHQFSVARFDEVDLLVALDRRHQQTLRSLAGRRPVDDRVVLLRSFDPGAGGAVDIADPFYGDTGDFARCLRAVESGCRGLVRSLARTLGLSPPAVGGSDASAVHDTGPPRDSVTPV